MSNHLVLAYIVLYFVNMGGRQVFGGYKVGGNLQSNATSNTATNSDQISVGYYSSDNYYCPSNCGTFAKAYFSCSCHPACSVFGDCCLDADEFYSKCYNFSSLKLPSFRDSIGPYKELLHCVGDDFLSHHTYWMVDECPSSWQGPGLCNLEVANKRLNQSNSSLQLADIPVLSENGVTFRNVFCAACHSVSVGSVIPWEVWANCPLNRNFSFLSFAQKIDFFNQKCSDIMLRPPATGLGMYTLNFIPCFETPNETVDSCHHDVTDESLIHKCSKILAPIEVDGLKLKNRFCFQCSSPEKQQLNLVEICLNDTTDRFYNWPSFSSLSIVFNFSNRFETNTTECEDGSVYDPFRSSCIDLSCWNGRWLRNKTNANNENKNSTLEKCEFYNLNTTIVFEPEVPHLTCKRMKEIGSSIYKDVFNPKNTYLTTADCFQNSRGRILSFQSATSSGSSFIQVLQKMTPDGNASLCENIRMENCKLVKEITIVGFCSRTEIECVHTLEYDVGSQLNEDIKKMAYESLIKGKMKLKYSYQRIGTGNVQESLRLRRCVAWSEYLSNCSVNKMDAALFRSVGRAGDLVYTLNEGVRLTGRMYRYTSAEEVTVCNVFNQTGNVTKVMGFFPSSMILGSIFSTIGISLSIISLGMCLTTYITFPSLRRQTGSIPVMALFANLMCAHICLLLCRIPERPSFICAILAACGHFFWLATFNTTTLVGFRLVRTFNLKSCIQRKTTVPTKIALKYIAMCFTLPFVFCIGILVLKSVNLIHIEYGYGTSCWIGGRKAHIYAFGVPGGAYLFINIGFFAKVTSSICSQQNHRKQLRPAYSRSKIQEFLIHVKVNTFSF